VGARDAAHARIKRLFISGVKSELARPPAAARRCRQ
jgi:hypothetical protein